MGARFLVVLAFLLVAPQALARTHRVPQIPHGNSFGCTSCHQTAGGGGNFTPFGTSTIGALVGTGTTSGLDVDWSKIYNVDSDRDGFTNGEELGDPNGTWKIGDPDPVGIFFHPGDDSKHPTAECGDGRVTPPEKCDGANTNGLSCINLGLDPGPLSCDESCQYITDQCGATDSTPDMGTQGTADVGTEPDPVTSNEGDTADEGCMSVGVWPMWMALFGVGLFRRRSRV